MIYLAFYGNGDHYPAIDVGRAIVMCRTFEEAASYHNGYQTKPDYIYEMPEFGTDWIRRWFYMYPQQDYVEQPMTDFERGHR